MRATGPRDDVAGPPRPRGREYPYPDWDDRHATRPRKRRRTGISGCLMRLTLGIVGAVALVAVLITASNLILKPAVGDIVLDDVRSGIRSEVQNQIVGQLDEVIAREVVITADDINQRLGASGGLGPIDDASVQISPDGLSVAVKAYGMSGTYHSTVAVSDGSIVLAPGSIDGPLGLVLPNEEIAAAVNSEIAAALAASGYHIDGVTMTDGAMVLAVSS